MKVGSSTSVSGYHIGSLKVRSKAKLGTRSSNKEITTGRFCATTVFYFSNQVFPTTSDLFNISPVLFLRRALKNNRMKSKFAITLA